MRVLRAKLGDFMAKVIVTLKIMPVSPDIPLDELEKKSRKMIDAFSDDGELKAETEPIAFGLKALIIMFVMDEAKGSTEFLESQINTIDGVNSVEVTDVRRAIG